MTDFKSSRTVMYSTPMDVRSHLDVLRRRVSDDTLDLRVQQEISDTYIEQFIYRGDALIKAYLAPVYGVGALSVSTPYFRPPVAVQDNQRKGVALKGVILGTDCITEQWLIDFIDKNTYSLIGSISGVQIASQVVTGDGTATSGDIQILAEDWVIPSGADIPKGDQYTFSTYVVHSTVNYISALLASAYLIDALYAEAESQPSGWGGRLYNRAMDLLNKLTDKNSPVSLSETQSEQDPSHVAVEWSIDEYGRDQTTYDEIENDTQPFKW